MIDQFKDRITDIIGFIILGGVSYNIWWEKSIPLVWEGIIGLIIGFSLFAVPDKTLADLVVKLFHAIINIFKKKSNGSQS